MTNINNTTDQKAFDLIKAGLDTIKNSSCDKDVIERAVNIIQSAKISIVRKGSNEIEHITIGNIIWEWFAKWRKEEVLTACSENTRVNHPSHYTWLKELCGVEVIDITRHMDFDLGNVIKYVLRHGKKKEEGINDNDKAIEDLEKASFYLHDKINMLKNNQIDS